MNSKDLRNLAEAYQNIQEEPRPARRRRPSKSVEQIKAEIDARNPTKAGPQTGRQIPGAAPKLEVKPITNPLPTKVQPPAPKPEFGPNAAKPTLYPKPTELRPGGQTPAPEFKTTQPPRTNPGGATVIPRTNANTRVVQPPAPKPQFGNAQVGQVAGTVSRGRQLLRNLKGLVKGPLAVGAEIAADATLTPVAKAAGTELGKALTRGVASATGTTDKVKAALPSYYGAKGPDLTRDIVQGVKSREPRRMSNIPPAEGPVNNPNFGKNPEPVKPAPAKKLSAAAKDFDRAFAAEREKLKSQGKDPSSGTFTWRGKSYNTKLKGE